MLESIKPGSLKTDVYKYAQANNLPLEPLKSFTDDELLRLDIVRLFVLPKSQKGVLEQKRDFPEKARQEVQLVSNFSSYATPIVTMNNLTLCNISNPYEIDQVSTVLSLGEGSRIECLQTWSNQGKQISEMSTESLRTQEEKAIQYNVSNAPRIRDGGPLSKRSLASYKREDMGEVSENLAPSWGIVKNDPPVYRQIERAFPATNKDVEGLLFKSHLQKYRLTASADTYKSASYSLRNFLDFQKEQKRTGPRMGLGVWPSLFRRSANDSSGRIRFTRKKGGGGAGGPKFSENRPSRYRKHI